MKQFLMALFIFSCVLCVFPHQFISAHQPRITESRQTIVPDPEISKAYYGMLTGKPDVYIIQAGNPFDLYVNILVPDSAGQKKDVSAEVVQDGKQIALLDGVNFAWKQFYEPFGADTYFMGPEYKGHVDAGTYEIRVSSRDNDSKYSLAIGEIEAFDSKEVFSALTIIPELKKNFFHVSPVGFIRSPFGWGLIVLMYFLAGITVFIFRLAVKLFSKGTARRAHNNIGKSDRLLRFAISIGLLLWAITTSWSPILIFFSGFAFFEAVFSWCAFYQALGKNTCPLS